MIKEQIERINKQVFNINSMILPAIGRSGNTNICPKCKSRYVRIHAENNKARVYCTRCFFENHYIGMSKK